MPSVPALPCVPYGAASDTVQAHTDYAGSGASLCIRPRYRTDSDKPGPPASRGLSHLADSGDYGGI